MPSILMEKRTNYLAMVVIMFWLAKCWIWFALLKITFDNMSFYLNCGGCFEEFHRCTAMKLRSQDGGTEVSICEIMHSNSQIWLTMFVSLLPNLQLWIVQMVRYYCFGLQKSTTEQK